MDGHELTTHTHTKHTYTLSLKHTAHTDAFRITKDTALAKHSHRSFPFACAKSVTSLHSHPFSHDKPTIIQFFRGNIFVQRKDYTT